MPEKKRTYEAITLPMMAVKYQSKDSKDDDQILGNSSFAPTGSGHRDRKGARVSVDIVLRLIEWFKAT